MENGGHFGSEQMIMPKLCVLLVCVLYDVDFYDVD